MQLPTSLTPDHLGAVLFWAGILQCAWTFVLYPLLIQMLASPARSHGTAKDGVRNTGLPTVTVLIAAYNEESRIGPRIQNLLACEYPGGLLDILVVSDGSTDTTAHLVADLHVDNVRVLELAEKSGKPSCLNAGVQEARGDVLVFADARQDFEKDAILQLVRHFECPEVTAVSGELFPHGSKAGTAQGIDFYWKLEKKLRHAESILDSCIGCTGAIYAMRREFYQPLPSDTLLDDVVLPMQAAFRGGRVLFEPSARAHDPQPLEPAREKLRKTRTLAGNFQMLFRYPQWLLPWRSRLWWKLASHKYSRLLTPVSLVAALVGAWLAKSLPLYQAAFWAQTTLYGMAVTGMLCPGVRTPLLSIPAGFLFLNCMVMRGFLHYLGGGYRSGWGKPTDP